MKDVILGRLGNEPDVPPLTPITAVIGKNGVGKSTFFDAFGFLADCMRGGVEEACNRRGGFQRLRTSGEGGPIEFEVCYRQDENAQPITYELSISLDDAQRPYVFRECLWQYRKGPKRDRLFFLGLVNGRGFVWKGETGGRDFNEDEGVSMDAMRSTAILGEESPEAEIVELEDNRKLGIATLGSLNALESLKNP